MRTGSQQIARHPDPADDPPDETERLRHSLARRDRRIAFLKRELRRTRDRENAELEAASDIIAGLEELLLLHRPPTDKPSTRRIAELEQQLAEMTRLAEMLFSRAGPGVSLHGRRD